MLRKLISLFAAAALSLTAAVTVYAEPPADTSAETTLEESDDTVASHTEPEEITAQPELSEDPEPDTPETDPPETDPPETETTVTTTTTATAATTTAAPTSVSFNVHNLTMTEGDTYALTVDFRNPTADSALRIYSTNINVARSDQNGLVTANGAGTAIITVIDDATGVFDTVNVTVSARPVQIIAAEGIELSAEALTLTEGETAQLTAAIVPAGAEGTVVFTSDNAAVAAVDANGTITAVGAGQAVITASVSGTAVSKTAAVTVKALIVNNLSLTGSIYMQSGAPAAGVRISLSGRRGTAVADTTGAFSFGSLAKGTYTVTADDGVSAYSSEIEITDSAHLFFLIKDGQLFAEDGYRKIESMFDIQTFELDSKALELKPGETSLLKYSYSPAASTVTSVVFESSNPSIASVGQDGTVTAKKTGTADILLSLNGSEKKSVCSLTVKAPDSTENSLLIVLIESGILAAAALVFVIMYLRYRKKHSSEEL